MACANYFIECTSISISYDIYGIATVNYTTVHQSSGFCYVTTITLGHQTFKGEVTSMTNSPIIGSNGWYETNVTLISTTY